MKREGTEYIKEFLKEHQVVYAVKKGSKMPGVVTHIINCHLNGRVMYVTMIEDWIVSTSKMNRSSATLIPVDVLKKVLGLYEMTLHDVESDKVFKVDLNNLKKHKSSREKFYINIIKGENDVIGKSGKWITDNYQALMKARTKQEIALEKDLQNSFGIVLPQQPFYIEHKIYFADFLIPDYKAVIEVDGGYHNEKNQMEYDKVREGRMKKLGYTTFRISNKDVRRKSAVSSLINKIKQTQKQIEI